MRISKPIISKACLIAGLFFVTQSSMAIIVIRKDDPVPPQPTQPDVHAWDYPVGNALIPVYNPNDCCISKR